MRIVRLVIVMVITVFACHSSTSAQPPEMRYQLGRRLTRFERQWQTADPASRARCTPKMISAVNSFFSLQLDAAIVNLDEAWLAVGGDSTKETPEHVLDAGWFLSVRPLLLDSNARSIQLSLLHQPPAATLPVSSTSCDLSVAILNAQSKQISERRWASVSNKDTWDWGMEPLPQGDYQVTATLHRGNAKTDVISNRISVISNLEKRIVPLRSQVISRRPELIDTKSLSIQSMAKMVLGGQDGKVSESDLPFEALLSDLEFLADEKSTVRDLVASRPERSIWLQLGKGKSKQHVRLQATGKQTKAPLVVAFHGAGGSENMFFESYGAGALIELCRQKGWSVVSPRQSLLGLGMELDAMLDELRLHLDFDPEKVFLIGHSMGAAQSVSQVSKHPTRVRAIAAIGGGGRPVKSVELTAIPFLVAAGEKDFGLGQAKLLADTLRAFGAEVDFREIKDVEHMVIVQATLNEAIAFFEKQK